MQVRVPTSSSLAIDRAAGTIVMVALASALLGPSSFAGLLTGIASLPLFTLTPMSIALQRKGEANPALVTPAERQAFLVKDTTLVAVMLACLGTVFYLIFTSQTLPIKAGVGLPALALAAAAGYWRGPMCMEHAARIFPIS